MYTEKKFREIDFHFTSFLAWTFLNFCAFETAIANSTSIHGSLKDIFVEWQYTHPFHEKYVHVQYNNLKCNKQDNNCNNNNVIWTIVIRWTNKIISSIEYIGSTTMLKLDSCILNKYSVKIMFNSIQSGIKSNLSTKKILWSYY